MGIFSRKKTAQEWFELAGNEDDVTKAIEYYSKGLQLEPSNTYVWYAKGCLIATLQKWQEAIECFNTALRLISGMKEKVFQGAILALTGGVYYAGKNYNEAIKYYDKAIDADPAISGACWHLKAHAFWDNNRHEDAIECFDKALELEPEVETLRLHAIATQELLSDPQSLFGSPIYAESGIRSEALREYLSDFTINIPPQISSELKAFIRASGMTLKKYPEPSHVSLLSAFADKTSAKQAIEFLGNTENINLEIPGFEGQLVTLELNQVAREFAQNFASWLLWDIAFYDNEAFMQVQETLKKEDLLESELPTIYKGVVLDLSRLRREFNFYSIYYHILGANVIGLDVAVDEEDFIYRHPTYDVEITVPADQIRAVTIWRMVLWRFR